MESFEQVLTSTLVGFRLEAFEPSPQGKEPHERRLLGDASLRMVSIRPAIRDLTAGAKRPTPANRLTTLAWHQAGSKARKMT